MNLGKMHLLATFAALTLASLGRAEDLVVVPPKGDAPPAFSNNPDPVAPAEFCPPSKSPRNITYPFAPAEEKMCPAGNAFSSACETVPGGLFSPTVYGSLGGIALRRTGLNSTDVASIAPALGFTNPTLVNVRKAAATARKNQDPKTGTWCYSVTPGGNSKTPAPASA